MKRRKIIPIIILLLGISVSVASYVFINQNIRSSEETKQIVVANRDMSPYETISSADIKYANVPLGTNTDKYFSHKENLIGKLTTVSLLQNDWIGDKSVTESAAVKDLAFLTLKTDYTRTGGAKPGDVVDIYSIQTQKKDGDIITVKKKIAENVIVIDVTDSNGTSVYENKDANVLGTAVKKNPVEAIKIAINTRKTNVSDLVSASIEKDNGYVMVVKNSQDHLVVGVK